MGHAFFVWPVGHLDTEPLSHIAERFSTWQEFDGVLPQVFAGGDNIPFDCPTPTQVPDFVEAG